MATCKYCGVDGESLVGLIQAGISEVSRLDEQITQLQQKIIRLRDPLAWIGLQACTADAEGASDDVTCDQTEACITEYCLSCYATAILKGEV